MVKTTSSVPLTPYVEWSPVIAGSAIALAISAILVPFGHAVGLSITLPLTEEKASGMILGVGIWLFWVQLISSVTGGYFTGKAVSSRQGLGPNEDDNEFRDGAHGLLSWAVSTVLTAIGVTFVSLITAIAPEQAPDVVENSAELAKRSAVVFSFAVGAGAIVSGAAAWIAATIGGDHRDNEYDFSKYSFRSKAKKKTK